MKVAVFTDTFLPQINGVTNTLRKLREYYEKKNIEYLFFAPDNEGELKSKNNVERYFGLKFFLYPECRLAIPNIFRLNNSLSEFKPDVIHLMTEINMGITGLMYAKKHEIPVISNYSTNFCNYLKYYKLDIFEKQAWNYMRWFHNQNDLVICPTEQVRTMLHNHGIDNVDIFSRGIDAKAFSPEYRNIEFRKKYDIDNKIVLSFVGRVAAEKDMDILIESYKNVKNKYSQKVALIITGGGPYLETCKKELPKDTIFTGFKKGKELSEIYASSDIFVFPSSTETFGNVVLEAMASGLPVIGADAGGVSEIISDGVNGIKFKQRNVLELTNSIFRLIENENLRNKLGENGRKTGLNRSWDKVFDKLVDNYCEIIGNKKYKNSITA